MENALGAVDIIVLIAILAISAGIGIYYATFAGKQRTSKEYFLADRSMHWFPVGVSLAVSVVSGIAFIGISSLSYYQGPGWWVCALSRFIGGLIIATAIAPVFYNLKITSIYEYLERRFNPVVRYLAVIVHVLTTFLVLGVMIYAPALALNAVTGLSITVSILTVGIVCTFYSTIGGIKAVIWTDFFQSFIMIVGILVVTITAIVRTGGIAEVWSRAEEGERTNLIFDFRLDPTLALSFWPTLIGGTFFVISFTAVNQNQAQRILTCDSLRSAKLSVVWGLLLQALLEGSVVFMGFVLFSYYYGCDPLRDGKISLPDQVVPFFMVEVFTSAPGVNGFLISAIFSATLSSVSTAINGLTTVTGESIVRRFWPTLPDRRFTAIMKGVAVIYGVLLVLMAWVASVAGRSLAVIVQRIIALLGPLSGVVLLGMFVPRGNTKGAIIGITAGLAVGIWMLVGALVYPTPPGLGPPVSIEFCSLSNDTVLDYTDDISATSASPPSDTRPWVYRVSFLYQGVINTVCTFLVGLIVSFATSSQYTGNDTIDMEVLSPVFISIYRKVPDSWKYKMKLVNQGEAKTEYKREAGKKASVNRGFENDTVI